MMPKFCACCGGDLPVRPIWWHEPPLPKGRWYTKQDYAFCTLVCAMFWCAYVSDPAFFV